MAYLLDANVFIQAKNLQVADYYLVAHALAHEHIVVTHEVAAASVKRIKIPDACIGLAVKCVNPYEMLRLERARFVLDAPDGQAGARRKAV